MSELREIREKIVVNIKEVAGQNIEKITDAYHRVMKLERITRREGLLALEYEAEFMSKEIPLCNELIEMIELVVDGTEPAIVEELMTIKFFATYDYTEIDELLYFLYARSMLMIQAGMSPRLIEKMFNAIIPKEVQVFEQESIKADEDKRQKIVEVKNAMTDAENELLSGISKKLQGLSDEEWKLIVSSNGLWGLDIILPYVETDTNALAKRYMNDYRYYVIMNDPKKIKGQELDEVNSELEKIIKRIRSNDEQRGTLDVIQRCTDEEIQLLLRNVDTITLSVALKGAREETAECFYRNLSLRLRRLIQEDMEYMGPVKMCAIEEAEEKIILLCNDLLFTNEK